jgi:type VI secretion system protein ImpG
MMSEELLPYYNRELSYIRRLAAEFATAHPKIAGRLRLGPDSSEDPHVERLIEAFAYLTARIRRKLDDDFPEITEALLGVLYPHYLTPLPSMAVAQFELDPQQSELTTGYTIPRHSSLETDPIQDEPCRFRTCYPVTLWPIELTDADLSPPPFTAPDVLTRREASSLLRLALTCRGQTSTFAQLGPETLRFFLRGQAQHVHRLYELLFNHTLAIALANRPNDRDPVLLGPECLRPVGFGAEEALLPYTARSSPGYRLLTEFFAYRPKFLFFDLTDLGPEALSRLGPRLEIYIYLSRTDADLERNVSVDTFQLGCTPIINLYRQRAEPILLTQADYEYRIVPDARRPLTHEVYAIEHVSATGPDGAAVEYRPFFSLEHAAADEAEPVFWHAVRRPAETAGDTGTEVFLALVDLRQSPAATAGWTVNVETTCLNRDLPARLPYGGDQPRLQLAQGGGVLGRIRCLTPPTRTLRPSHQPGKLWRLVSHLSLGHLSLVNHDDKALALREVLKLYDFTDSAETRKMIDGLAGLHSRHVVGAVHGDGVSAFCQGVEVAVQLDEAKFTGGGLFLFAAVLERFLALYCSINSFTQLVASIRGREGDLRRWPPRAGEKVLI